MRHATGMGGSAIAELSGGISVSGMPGFDELKRSGALQGIRILDFGTAWAGSIPGHVLADFGAEVIKIESQDRVDLLRYGPGPYAPMRGKPWTEARECNTWFHSVNRGKLGVTINFTTARGAELIRQLVAISDIVVDNFTPDVLPKYNLHYEALTAIKPDLIMLSISVAGQHGPYRDTRAYAFNLHGLSGFASLIGFEGDTEPQHIDIAYADWNAGMFGTYSLILALFHRQRTGEGQGLGPERHLDRLLHEQAQADGGDHQRHVPVRQHAVHQHALEHPAQQQGGKHQCQREAGVDGKAEQPRARQHQEGGQHDELALGEIDRLRGLP